MIPWSTLILGVTYYVAFLLVLTALTTFGYLVLLPKAAIDHDAMLAVIRTVFDIFGFWKTVYHLFGVGVFVYLVHLISK